MAKKKCSRCGFPKPLKDFSKKAASPDGRQAICRQCYRTYRNEIREQQRQYDQAYRDRHKAQRKRARLLQYREQSASVEIRNQRQDKELRKKYGISLATYRKMLKAQGGVCAICHQPETLRQYGKVRSLVVDHCHRTEKIRLLLCNRCNSVLGLVMESRKLLREMIVYLTSQRAQAKNE